MWASIKICAPIVQEPRLFSDPCVQPCLGHGDSNLTTDHTANALLPSTGTNHLYSFHKKLYEVGTDCHLSFTYEELWI